MIKLKKRICRPVTFGGLLVLSSYSTLAQAQVSTENAPVATADTDPSAPAEIIVTANKREESISKVGLTITALSGDALKSRGVTSLADIAAQVPGLSYTSTSYATPVYTLRGVGFYDSSLASYPTTSVYVDEVPLPFPAMSNHANYDVQRLEVLKGPQGTLFGQNSTGGAINFIAAKPTDVFEAGGDVTYGRFNSIQGNAYISGPLTDNLKARIAVTGEHTDDWQRSYLRNDTTGATRYFAGRLLVDWNPSSRLRLQLNINGWKDNSKPQATQLYAVGPQGTGLPAQLANQPLAPLNSRDAEWGSLEPRSNNRFAQASLRFDYDVTDGITLTGISSYANYDQYQVIDQDGTALDTGDVPYDKGHIRSFTQELRIANSGASRFRWIVGVNLERSEADEEAKFVFEDSSTAAAFGFTGAITSSDQQLRNYAGFANLEFELTPQITLRGGARYTEARRKAVQCTRDPGDGTFSAASQGVADAIQLGFIPIPGFTPSGVPAPTIGNGCTALDNVTSDGTPATYLPGAYNATLNQSNVSWKVGADYKPTDNVLLYANIAKGFKAGGFPIISAATFEQYLSVTQESLLDYEAGFKIVSDDRRLHFNGAAFYYDYTNKQLRGTIVDPIFGVLEILKNVPKSRIFGVEADLSYVPVSGLTLSASASYLDSKIEKYSGLSASGQPTDYAGSVIPFTPKFSATVSADYAWEMGGLRPFVGVSASSRTSAMSNVGGDKGYVPANGYRSVVPLGETYKIDGYTLVDLRAGVEAADGSWRFSVFGKNVFNQYYINNTYLNFDTVGRLTGMPVTWGATLGFKFR